MDIKKPAKKFEEQCPRCGEVRPQLRAAESRASALARCLDYFANVQDCNCNQIEWPDEVCAHRVARGLLAKEKP